MIDNIFKKVSSLVSRCETRDPFRIADKIGIDVDYNYFVELKGFYTCILRSRHIVINDHMDEYMQRLVCAHELGHDQLHRNTARNTFFKDSVIYDHNMKLFSEFEANVFAAELLLPDETVMDMISLEYSLEQIAGAAYVDVNLAAIKINNLIKKGYDLKRCDYRDDFLRY